MIGEDAKNVSGRKECSRRYRRAALSLRLLQSLRLSDNDSFTFHSVHAGVRLPDYTDGSEHDSGMRVANGHIHVVSFSMRSSI